MPKPRALAVLVPLLLLTACGTEGGAGSGAGAGEPDLPVAGTHWTVDAVTVDGRRSAAPDGAHVDFEKDGLAQGSSGCNTFGAGVVVRGDTLTVAPVEVTAMGCADDRKRFEAEFLKAFSGPLKGTMKGDDLRLASSDGRNGVELTAEEEVPLRGTAWKVDGLVSGDTASSLPAGSGAKARLVIGADGRITGNLGCNGFSAVARVDEKARTLTVEGPAATTRMMCTSPQMRLETKLYELLDGPLGYRLNHRTLTLTDASGEGLTATATAR
ncbi:META domain-containing protein [Streptomyces globisporus]|uniref:META domain-containing protein n=1 Tax=Streptomyces globisporus TaxID=1908 RepID=UPI0004C78B13|nr:META domain-containing protein [Streptomyces globisporus]